MLLATAQVTQLGILTVALAENAVACTDRIAMDAIDLEIRIQMATGTPEPPGWPELAGPSLFLGPAGAARVPAGAAGPGYLQNHHVRGQIFVDGIGVPFGTYHVFVKATPGTFYPLSCYLQKPVAGGPPNVVLHFSPTNSASVAP